jgi:hypothetical protein
MNDERSDILSPPTFGCSSGAFAPVSYYPLYENGLRAARKQSYAENERESAELYAQFAKTAEKLPASWNFGAPAKTKDEILTVSEKNRMIYYPCE